MKKRRTKKEMDIEFEKTIDTGQSRPGTSEVPPEKKPQNSSFSAWKRNISPTELNKPEVAKAVAKILLTQNDDLTKENGRLRVVENDCHDANTKVEVLKERIRNLRKSLGARLFLSSAGTGVAGFSPFFWEGSRSLFFVRLIGGTVAAAIGLLMKEQGDAYEE